MNAHRKLSLTSLLTSIALSLILTGLVTSNASAAPCFDDPERAYEYLLAKENAAIQARDQKIININRASEGELVSLDGIGSSKAQAIILYRDMFGSFKTVDELVKVKGIGAKTVEKNKIRLRVHD